MSGETQRKRRVVSKREYVAYQGKRTASFAVGTALLLAALTCTGLTAGAPIMLWIAAGAFAGIAGLIFFGGLSAVFWFSLFQWEKEFESRERVVPLTRHNTGDLPEPESLVRASEEPPALQSEVLLRAVQSNLETPEEQLLRPIQE